MERNLTQREYEELNSRREAAGRPPLSYRDELGGLLRVRGKLVSREWVLRAVERRTPPRQEPATYTAEAEKAEGRAGQQFPELHLDRGLVGPILGSMELAGYSMVGAPGL